MKFRIASGKIHQVIGMNDQRLKVVAFAQAAHLFALRPPELVGRPLARARRENLKGIAAQTIGAFCGLLNSTGRGSMDADPARGQLGRHLRRRQQF